MHQIDPTAAQRVDRREDERGLYIGLHRGVWPLYSGEAAHAATEVDEATQPQRIVRWNEGPNYPHFGEEDGQPRRQRVPEGGAIAIGLLIVAAASALYLIFG